MGFLPFPSDDEFSPEAARAAAAFQVEHPGPLSNLDRTLLGSAPVFDAYLGWFAARDEVVPTWGSVPSTCTPSRSASPPAPLPGRLLPVAAHGIR